ncbi:MAG: hypothetical protein ACK4YP_28130, partial [Myxococcota bacterium]
MAEPRDPLTEALSAVRAFTAADPAVVSGRGLDAVIAGVGIGAPRKAWLLPGRRERAVVAGRGGRDEKPDQART